MKLYFSIFQMVAMLTDVRNVHLSDKVVNFDDVIVDSNSADKVTIIGINAGGGYKDITNVCTDKQLYSVFGIDEYELLLIHTQYYEDCESREYWQLHKIPDYHEYVRQRLASDRQRFIDWCTQMGIVDADTVITEEADDYLFPPVKS